MSQLEFDFYEAREDRPDLYPDPVWVVTTYPEDGEVEITVCSSEQAAMELAVLWYDLDQNGWQERGYWGCRQGPVIITRNCVYTYEDIQEDKKEILGALGT